MSPRYPESFREVLEREGPPDAWQRREDDDENDDESFDSESAE